MTDHLRRYAPLRELDAPKPVLVDLATAFAHAIASRRDRPSAATNAFGMNVSSLIPARLLRWVRTEHGDWLAHCEVTLYANNDHARLTTMHLFPVQAIEPLDESSRSATPGSTGSPAQPA
jgi:hypothetical protein